jgi:hypothetical protein
MNKVNSRKLRIVEGAVCLLLAVLLALFPAGLTPPAVQILTVSGLASAGVLLILWRRVPEWLAWSLLLACFAGLISGDLYEVIQGQRHWVRLVPYPMLLLMVILGRRGDHNAA